MRRQPTRFEPDTDLASCRALALAIVVLFLVTALVAALVGWSPAL